MLRLGPQRSEDHAPSAVLHGLKLLSPRPTALPPMRHESYLMALQQVAVLGMLLSSRLSVSTLFSLALRRL